MTLNELIEICLTHNISPNAEIFVNGTPAKDHFFFYRETEFPDQTSLCFKIDLRNL